MTAHELKIARTTTSVDLWDGEVSRARYICNKTVEGSKGGVMIYGKVVELLEMDKVQTRSCLAVN